MNPALVGTLSVRMGRAIPIDASLEGSYRIDKEGRSMLMQQRFPVWLVQRAIRIAPSQAKGLVLGMGLVGIHLAMMGCASYGSSRIVPDRIDYSDAIRQSESEQLLKNIVRLRFSTTPEILDMSQIVTSYQLELVGGSGATLTSGGPNTFPLTVGGQLQESPTITYAPVTGEGFAMRMLAPIKPWQFYLLSSSGWDLRRLLMSIVQELNGLENLKTSFGFSSKQAPKSLGKFNEAIMLLEQMEINGSLKMTMSDPSMGDGSNQSSLNQKMSDSTSASMRAENFGGLEYHLVFVEEDLSDAEKASAKRLKNLLGLDADQNTFQLLPSRSVNKNEEQNAIVISNRSMLSVLLYLADGVELPEELRAKYPGAYDLFNVDRTNGGDGQTYFPSNIFTVYAQKEEPENPFIAIRHDGYWFWIDKYDQMTKTTFSLLEYLLRLQQINGTKNDNGVLLTIPTR